MSASRGAALAALVMVSSACLPSSPPPDDWGEQATISLEDVASELATAQVVLREEQRGNLLDRTQRVILVQAEEAAGTASDSFTTLQPPAGHRGQQSEIATALGDGVDLVTEVRIAVTASDEASYADLGRRLETTRSDLLALIGGLP